VVLGGHDVLWRFEFGLGHKSGLVLSFRLGISPMGSVAHHDQGALLCYCLPSTPLYPPVAILQCFRSTFRKWSQIQSIEEC